jgi:hypothetical protein
MRDQEEIELSILSLGLFNESLVNVGTRRWVEDLLASLFEDALSHSLVDDDEGDLGHLLS